ncbi:Ubiquitin carboxyl-terminal hydrolase 42 [Nymphon striatum]|nr:Ubiquitin carboxyl-terminal hydrolase 42 [Nymphon striatum]
MGSQLSIFAIDMGHHLWISGIGMGSKLWISGILTDSEVITFTMPVSGDTLSLPSSESAISKTLNKIFKGSNDTHLDSAIKSAHHSSILNKPLKFKVSEQTNLTSISNLKQLYTPVQNGAVSRNLNFEPKAKKLQQIKKAEKVEDDVPIAKITISQPLEVKLTWSRSHRVGCGLRNLGNSCFMNAVLQCLTYLPPVAYALVEKNHLNQCYVKGFCTLCEVQKHIHRVMTSSDQWVAPSFIFNNLSKIGNFVRHKQEDAHEFLRYLLCHMEKCALDNFKTKHSINIDAASSRTTIINNIFGGYNRSQVICLKCKEKSNTFDPFMDTMLDIKNTESLDGALMKYVQPETLEGDNAYKCSQCKCRVPAQKRVTIHQAPSVCTFHLKRFQYNNAYCCKIGKIIKFPEKLNLRPYMSESKFLRRDLALTLKKRLLDCYVKSVAAYGCEAWTFSKEIIARINALQLWCYRRMLKVKYTDHVTNKKVKELIGAENIQWAEDLARRKLKFAGHVMRGCCDTLTQLVLEGLVEGKRDRGRQRRVWGDDLKEWTKSKNLGEVKRKAENKVVWRIMVPDLRFEDVT